LNARFFHHVWGQVLNARFFHDLTP